MTKLEKKLNINIIIKNINKNYNIFSVVLK